MKINEEAQKDIGQAFLMNAESQKKATESITQLFDRLDQLADELAPLAVEQIKNDIEDAGSRTRTRAPESIEYLRSQAEEFGFGDEATILAQYNGQEYVISCDLDKHQYKTLKTLAVKQDVEFTHVVGKYDWVGELKHGQQVEEEEPAMV